MRKSSYAVGLLVILFLMFSAGAQIVPRVPTPKIELVSMGQSTTGVDATGQPYYEIALKVTNWKSFDPTLFDRSPELPACGATINAPRTWVAILGNTGPKDSVLKQIGANCDIFNPEGLQKIAFNVEHDKIPTGVVIALSDRKTGKVHYSNCLELRTGKTCLFMGTTPPLVVIPTK